MKHQPQIKIVTCEWIVDSITANRLLAEDAYEPLPALLRSPLRPFNTQGNVQLTPKVVSSTASTFMTPITPSQSYSNDIIKKAIHTELPSDSPLNLEDKENSGKVTDNKSM